MAQPSGGSVSASGNPLIDGLLQGNSWTFPSQPRVITYSLNTTGFGGSWTPALAAAVDSSFAAWEAVANVDFQNVLSGTFTWESSADIAIGLTGDRQMTQWGTIGYAAFPNSAGNDINRADFGALLGQTFNAANYAHPEGDIYLDNASTAFGYLDPGGLGLSVILHEIGHAIGLKHPHDGGGTGMPTFGELGIANMDNDSYTVMSYNSPFFGFPDTGNPSTPMVLDILAIQYIYGANMSYHTGDDVYKFGQDDVYTIWDAGGIDTIDASLHAGIFLKLDAGSTNIDKDSWSTLGIAYGVTIENAIGSNWQDFIWGNEVANTISGGGGGDNLYGGAGNDILYGGDANPFDPGISDDHMNGGSGADTLIGGTGNDIYDVDTLDDALEDTFIEEAGGGTDRIFTTVTLSLAGYANIEGLTLVGDAAINGYGNNGDNQLHGNTANNELSGGDGNDVLGDAVDSDEDILIGGRGDDIYALGAGETIVELAGEGIDTVRTSLQLYALADNVENLEVFGFNGQSTPWRAIGNALDNKITGTNFKDILDGGAGSDTLMGGGSADIYYLDSEGDQIVGEINGFFAELDEARTWVSIGAQSFNVEIFTLLGSANLTVYGNSLDNTITGNAGANFLYGQGGKDQIVFGDQDVVSGGAGTDSFTFLTEATSYPITGSVTDFGFGETITWTTLLPLEGAASQIAWPITTGDGSATGLHELEYFSDGITVTLSFGLDDLAGADLFLTLDQWIALADLDVAAHGSTVSITNDKTPPQTPTDITLSSNTVFENSTNGTVIGILGAVDGDSTTGFVYELMKDADGRFALDGDNLIVAGALDYELLRDHAITVRVTDPTGNSYDEAMTIKVLDVNDVVPIIMSNGGLPAAAIEIPENYTLTAAQVFAVDGDGLGNTPITYSISGGADKDLFAIDSKTGELRFLVGPDFEKPTSSMGTNDYVVEVKASDGMLSDTQTLTFTITDVDNTPVITSNGGGDAASIMVAESTSSALAQVLAGGNDATAVYSYAIAGGADADLFKIDSKTGHLYFKQSPDFENPFGPDNLYHVTVGASYFGATDAQNLTIVVTDVGGSAIVGTARGDVITGSSLLLGKTTNENDAVSAEGGNDVVETMGGNDVLDGGTGNDTLRGGSGSDTYVINSAGDKIDEAGNTDAGDSVRGTVSVDLNLLGAGALEDATLAGTGAIHASGNSNNNRLTGNAAANILDGRGGADTMEGGNGADTYIVDHIGDKITETNAAAAGGIDLVKSSVSFSLGANLEKLTLIGAGHIDGTGNGLNNTLIGNDGNNRLDGGAGNDALTGGKGNDTYVVSVAGDVVNETISNALGGGVDTVESAITYSLAAKANVENLVLTGFAVNATGNTLANVLTGNSLANVLDGGKGADRMAGGGGNDLYLIDHAADVVEELGSDSADEARSASVLMAAMAGVEHYAYTGTKAWAFVATAADNKISGGSGADNLNGADGNDILLGNGGNDVLTGGAGADLLDGGTGNDMLRGGSGNDIYVVNAAGDKLDEQGSLDSADLVRSTVSVNLSILGAGLIENAILLGAAAINATGNASLNRLTGNDGANILDGSVGADILEGGKGADTYVVDQLDDQVLETIAETAGGTDTVKSSVSWTLGANLEKLMLTGAGHIDGFGNGLNNTILGNDGNNRLDGGAGNDSMTGGKGNDIYVVNSATDIVSETVTNAVGGGVDTVESSVTFTLATRANVENLELTGFGNINGTGNALANLIEGNSGANKIDGGSGNDLLLGNGGNDTIIGGLGNDTISGGLGADRLTGSAGRDVFDFDLLAEAGDTITDFAKGAAGDVLDLRDLLDGIGYAGSDPFADGILGFSQSGANTIVRLDVDGAGANLSTDLATLLNVSLTAADTNNFLV